MYQIDFNRPIHTHFIGIGGISMSGLAEVLLKAGFTVSGSDSQESALLDHLRSLGAQIMIGQSADNIHPDMDLVVYTAAIHPDNPEFAAAVKAGIPMLTRADLLGEIMANYSVSVAVAGTHGKTTTTSMASHILMEGGFDPTISVGGILPSIGGNIRVGASDTFITEACEYTDSFLSLYPRIGIILNVDSDHLDYFEDINAIAASFHRFASQIPADGVLIMNRESQSYEDVTHDLACRVISYALQGEADYTAREIAFDNQGCASFTCLEKGEPIGSFTLKVPGIHNVSNALAAIAMGCFLGMEAAAISDGLVAFTGTDRRFEYKGRMGGVTVIDDYAHHPTEIKATLAAARRYPHRKLWVIFQPHTYSRTIMLMDDFARELSAADHVVLAEIYAARETNDTGISSSDLGREIARYGTDVHFFPTFSEIQQFVRSECVNGDLLITMGAGNVTNIGPELVD